MLELSFTSVFMSTVDSYKDVTTVFTFKLIPPVTMKHFMRRSADDRSRFKAS